MDGTETLMSKLKPALSKLHKNKEEGQDGREIEMMKPLSITSIEKITEKINMQ